MSRVKDQLLNILGDFAMDELSEGSLLDVLHTKLKSQEGIIASLRQANAAERQRLFDETERLHREIKEIHRNPNKLIALQSYFKNQNGDVIEVVMKNGQLQACEKIGKAKIKYVMQQIPPSEAWT